MITMMKIILKRKNNIYIYINKQSPCEWSFLIIRITTTTNETLTTADKALTGTEKKKKTKKKKTQKKQKQ